jgi:hypothetical protein
MFIEMEEASLFALARLAGFRAASIVVASDRLESRDGILSQEFGTGISINWNGWPSKRPSTQSPGQSSTDVNSAVHAPADATTSPKAPPG